MRTFILGTDWGMDCDDVTAVRILARAHKAGKIRIAGIGINHCFNTSVASLDGFLSTEGVFGIPIGIDRDIIEDGDGSYQKRLAERAVEYKNNDDAEDAVRLYRAILHNATEKVEIAEVGFHQVIAKVLMSGPDDISEKTGLELFSEKVAKVWVMGGKWDVDEGAEFNFNFKPITRKASHTLCEICPVPITFLGFEIGCDVITGSKLPKDDVLRVAMADYGWPDGRFSWDPMTVALAIDNDTDAWEYDTVRGTAFVDVETGKNRFEKSENGLHEYLVRRQGIEYYADRIDELIK